MKCKNATRLAEVEFVVSSHSRPITAGGRSCSRKPTGALANKDIKVKVRAAAFTAISRERAARRAKGSQSKGKKSAQ